MLLPVDYEISAVMQRRVYQRQMHSVEEFKQQLIDVCCGLEQSIFDEATDQWWERLPACVSAKAGHFENSLWIDIEFVHILSISVWLDWLLHL